MAATHATSAAGHKRPRGGTPKDCYWDPHHEPCGHWRRTSDDELFDPKAREKARKAKCRRTTAAARRTKANTNARAYANASRRRRNTRVNAARCNDVLFKPEFDLATVTREDVGAALRHSER